MLENAVYLGALPEGFAAILWKDSSRSSEACDVMKLTAADLLELKVIDGVIPEPEGGAHTDPQAVYRALDELLVKEPGRPVQTEPCGTGRRPLQKIPHDGRWRPEKGASMSGIKLISTGSALPVREVTNFDMEKLVETTMSGSPPVPASRPAAFAAGEECHTSLCLAAARQALERSGLRPEQIGVCLVATLTQDTMTPFHSLCAAKGAGPAPRTPSALI